MSFLFPLYLLAAAAVAAPIWFHLRSRRPRREQAFPSLMFLQPQKEPLQRRRRPQDWLLLLVRCLALVLLALLFARPWLQGVDSLAGDAGEGRRVAVLLDASASMQRDDLWPRAVVKARQALDRADGNGGNQVWFGLYGRGPGVEWLHQPAAPDLAGDRAGGSTAAPPADWAALLHQLQPGWGGAGLVAALRQTVETLEAGRGIGVTDQSTAGPAVDPGPAAEVVLVSDLQEGEDWELLGQWSWPVEVALSVVAVAPGEGDARRVSLHGVPELMEDELGDPDRETAAPMVRLTASPTADGDEPPMVARLYWHGEEPHAVVHTLAAGASRVLYAPPRAGGATGPAELWVDDGRSGIEASDRPGFDQRLFVADRAPRTLQVLWWSDAAGVDDGEGSIDSGFFLRQALLDSARTSWLLGRWPADGPVPAGTDAVVVVGSLSLEAGRWLADYVEAGGTVIGVPGAGEAAGWAVVLAAEAGELIQAEAMARGRLWVDQAWQHPVLRPFAVAGANDFSKIRFWQHRTLPLPEGAQVLASFDSGQPALAEVGAGDGRWFLLGSGWIPDDSQLGVASKFLPLLHGMLLSGNREDADPMLLAGQPAPWPGLWRTPDGALVELADDPDRRMELVLAVPGHYGWRAPGSSGETVVAVNVAPRESELRALSRGELQDLGLPVASDRATAAAPDAGGGGAAEVALPGEVIEQRQQLWRWLLMAVLGLLLLELWLASRPRTDSGAGAMA